MIKKFILASVLMMSVGAYAKDHTGDSVFMKGAQGTGTFTQSYLPDAYNLSSKIQFSDCKFSFPN